MALALFKPKQNEANLTSVDEQELDKVSFNVYKFNHRPKPKKKNRIKIVSCFSEFGCEIVGNMYCLPRLLRRFPGSYVIAMGWYGREYLYRHLVDEFWEVKEEYMWLREYTRAFHHVSDNLERIEKSAAEFGEVVPSDVIGKYAVSNFCRTCGKFWNEWRRQTECCPVCSSTVIVKSLFTDIKSYKPYAKRIPVPSLEMIEWAKTIVKPNTVGVFARGRKTYGRNLSPDFYVELVKLLENMGYNIIWLGEKSSTQPCPVEHITDFSRMEESRDLEKTLAIIKQLSFTIQFWTASTRLAGMMGVPFLLFESPEQVYVSYSGIMSAQEGKRLELTTFGARKIVLAHYNNVKEDHETALDLVRQSVDEMNEGNFDDVLGMVEDREFATLLQQEHYEMLT